MIIATSTSIATGNIATLSKEAENSYKITYGLEVIQRSDIAHALEDFAACVQHGFEGEGHTAGELSIETLFVYFRVFDDGDVIALWREPYDSNGLISSYQHVGQHSGADAELIDSLRKATPDEKAALFSELERVGYTVIDADRG